VAVTSLRGVVNALIKPSAALTAELGGMTVKADGFRAVMDKVGSLSAVDLAELFPNVRALTGVVVAAKDLGDEVDKITSLMAEGSPMMAAFDKNMSTFAATWDRFKATLKATSITIGNELLPIFKTMFESMIGWFQDNREGFANFAKTTLGGIRKLVNIIIGLKEILLGAGAAVMSLMVLSKVTALMAAFGVATSIALGPVALIAASVTLLIAGFFKLKKELKEEKEEQQLLNEAMEGGVSTSEEYDKALEIQVEKLHDIQNAHAGNIQRMERSGMVTKAQMDISQKSYDANTKNEQDKINLIVANRNKQAALDKELADQEKAKAEKERAEFIAEQNRITALNIAETEKAELLRRNEAEEKQRLEDFETEKEQAALDEAQRAQDKIDDLAKFRMALFEASATKEELWEVEKERLEELGATQEEILAWYDEKFPEAVTTATEAFTEKFTKATDDVKRVFSLLYSSLTGTTNQYFANMFSKLDKETATKKKNAKDTITDEDELAAALAEIDKEAAKKKYDLELKQFNTSKAMNIAQALMNTAEAISKALTLGPILGIVMAGIVGALGAVQIGLIASQAPPPAPFIRGGLTDKMISGGAVRGNPGIDTNNVALTNREYVMPPQQSMDNFDELEDMRAGGSGGKNITIMPAHVELIMDDRSVGTAVIEFMTEESDRGGFRINPKVLGALT